MRWAALLSLLLPVFWASDFSSSPAQNLSLYDKDGNNISAQNRSQAGGYQVEIVSLSRYGSINWDRIHQDGLLERVNTLATDLNGNIYVAGSRVWNDARYLWVMKLNSRGEIVWERAELGHPGCAAFVVVANLRGDAWASGACHEGQRFPARVTRFDPGGATMWVQLYDEGGRNYVRGINVDFTNRVAIQVEVGQGNYTGVNNPVRTVVFDQSGNRVAVY